MVCDETELALLALPADMNCLRTEPTTPMVESRAAIILAKHRIIRFHGRAMIELDLPYPRFVSLNKDLFSEMATPLLGWVKQQHLNHLYDYLTSTAPDLSWSDRFIVFGDLSESKANISVWDMERLEFRSDISPRDCVRRSPYSVKQHSSPQDALPPIPLIMQLAGGDKRLYDDIMQTLAPLVMSCKPEGVVWWVGGDAESKQLLIEAVYRILPNQLAKLDVERLNRGRRTPTLNGKLGNVVQGGSSAVADISLYRSLAKHQTFGIHRYRSQEGLNILGNVHHIFSSPHAPTFSRKTWSTQRRTVIIPLSHHGESKPLTMLSDQSMSDLLAEICAYAEQIKRQGYRYNMSAATLIKRSESHVSVMGVPTTPTAPAVLHGSKFIW